MCGRANRARWITLLSGTLLTALAALPAASAAGDPSSEAATPAAAAEADLPLHEWLDREFGLQWEQAGVDVELCDDATFLRRVYLDLAGRIPSVSRARAFLADSYVGKRAQLVDTLLADGAEPDKTNELYAEHMARIWRRIMIPPGSPNEAQGPQFDPWLEAQFRENVGYDDLARRLVTLQGGDNVQNAAAFYQAVGASPETSAGAVTRVFLGVRIACAQCHTHPFAEWTQKDFWGMAAFFAGTTPQPQRLGAQPATPPPSPGVITNDGVTYNAKVLWDAQPVSLTGGKNPQQALADWLTSEKNPNFAATAVNRVWQHLFGRGLIEAVDDLDQASTQERAILLDKLGRKFVDADYDLRWLVSGICKSKVYQCRTLDQSEGEVSPFLGTRPLKVLTPDQVFDSLEQALLLPVTRSNDGSARYNGQRDQMLQRLNESAARSPEEYSAGVPQVLMFMNGEVTANATSLDKSFTLTAVVESPPKLFPDAAARLDALFLAVLTRLPTDKERALFVEHLESQSDASTRRTAYAEIMWALINSPEFVLSR